jgi:hypothetical protein
MRMSGRSSIPMKGRMSSMGKSAELFMENVFVENIRKRAAKIPYDTESCFGFFLPCCQRTFCAVWPCTYHRFTQPPGTNQPAKNPFKCVKGPLF